MIFMPPVPKLTHYRLQLNRAPRTACAHALPRREALLASAGQLSQAPDEVFFPA